MDLRKSLYSNIVLSGGTTLCTGVLDLAHSSIVVLIKVGYGDRLLNEVKRMKDGKIKIYAPPERKYSTWIGGSILAGLNTFKKVCLSDMYMLFSCLISLRCGYQRRSIKRIQTLSIRNSDFDIWVTHLLLPMYSVIASTTIPTHIHGCPMFMYRRSSIMSAQSHAVFALMHMCDIHGGGRTRVMRHASM
jgi:hypothetical protein